MLKMKLKMHSFPYFWSRYRLFALDFGFRIYYHRYDKHEASLATTKKSEREESMFIILIVNLFGLKNTSTIFTSELMNWWWHLRRRDKVSICKENCGNQSNTQFFGGELVKKEGKVYAFLCFLVQFVIFFFCLSFFFFSFVNILNSFFFFCFESAIFTHLNSLTANIKYYHSNNIVLFFI